MLPLTFALIEAHRLVHSQAALRWLAALPPHCGVLIRRAERCKNARALHALVRAARAERRCVLIGGDWRLAWQLGAGAHFSEAALRRMGRQRPRQPASAAVHSHAALQRALRQNVALIFVSPVFATLTHPHARPLGALRFAQWAQHLTRRAHAPALYALGGMNAKNWRRLSGARIGGRAAGYAAQRDFAISAAPLCAPKTFCYKRRKVLRRRALLRPHRSRPHQRSRCGPVTTRLVFR